MTNKLMVLPLFVLGLVACGPELPEREGALILEPGGRAPSGYVPYG